MNISISSRHMTLSRSSRRLVASRLFRLKRYFKRISRIRLIVEPVKENVCSNLHVQARSGFYRAKVVGSTLSDVVTSACDMVARQRKINKRIGERTRRHPVGGTGKRLNSVKLATDSDWTNDLLL